MRKHEVEITIRAQVFGETEADIADTVANSLEGNVVPGLSDIEVTSLRTEYD